MIVKVASFYCQMFFGNVKQVTSTRNVHPKVSPTNRNDDYYTAVVVIYNPEQL